MQTIQLKLADKFVTKKLILITSDCSIVNMVVDMPTPVVDHDTLFLVTQYTDLAILAHTPKGEVCTQ